MPIITDPVQIALQQMRAEVAMLKAEVGGASFSPVPVVEEMEGKTLRDEFAMAAMMSLAMRVIPQPDGKWRTLHNDELADQSFKIANAMLAARKKGQHD